MAPGPVRAELPKRPDGVYAAWERLQALAHDSADQARDAGYQADVLNLSGTSANYTSLSYNQAKAHLQRFAAYAARQNQLGDDMGLVLDLGQSAKWFRRYAARAGQDPGLELLRQAQKYCAREFGVNEEQLWSEILAALLDKPSDLDWLVEQVCIHHLNTVLHKGKLDWKGLSVIPFESSRTAMVQAWRTLEKNGLIRPADLITLLGPVSPMRTAGLDLGHHKIIHLTPEPNRQGRHLAEKDLWPLDNDKLRAMVMVNPSSPGAWSLDKPSVTRLAGYIKQKRPSLTVFSMWQGAGIRILFPGLMIEAPRNVIGIYSFEDYLGPSARGAAYLAINSDFVLNKDLAKHSKEQRQANALHYGLSLGEEAGFGGASAHTGRLRPLQRSELQSGSLAGCNLRNAGPAGQGLLSPAAQDVGKSAGWPLPRVWG